MILKIKRLGNNQDWWMIDNIRKISKSVLYTVDSIEMNMISEQSAHDIVIFDRFFDEDTGSTEYDFIILICRDSNDNEFSIAFDTVAFICNDEGRTVERIVARR